MKLEITSITILTGENQADKIILNTDLPEGCWPYTGKETFSTSVAQGMGTEYVKIHFPGIPVKVVEV